MAHLGKTKIWVPDELIAKPYLMGMGLVIAFDAFVPFLNFNPGTSLLLPMDFAEATRTVLFLLAALAATRVRILSHVGVFQGVICISASAGVGLVQLTPFIGHPVVASVTTAIGSIGIGMFWCFATLKFFELLTGVSLECTVATLVFSHLAGSGLASIVVLLDAYQVAIILLFLIPLVLFYLGIRNKSLIQDVASIETASGLMQLNVPVRPLALMIVTLFVAAMVRSRIPVTLEPATYLGALICAAFLFAVIQIKQRSINPRMLYYLTLFLLMVGLLIFTAQGEIALVAAGGSVNAGYLCFDILVLVLLCNVCRRYVVNPYWVFGLLGFIKYMAYVAGNFAGMFLNTQLDYIRFVAAFACAIVVAFAFVTLLTENDYRTSWGIMKDEAKANPVSSYYQSLPNACTTISEQFGLTRREEDVLLLLAQRKTIPDIERELYISNSTVKTHCKNIYKKLGVHKRKELLVLMQHPSVTREHTESS